jgi:hypothetical protein
MIPAHSKLVLASAAIYNMTGGIAIIFFLHVLAPLLNFEPIGNMLFRLFVGGTAVTLGVAYLQIARAGVHRVPLLAFGTVLKYWAFLAALVSYFFFGLSAEVFVLFGVTNLCFAILFTLVYRADQRMSNPMQ